MVFPMPSSIMRLDETDVSSLISYQCHHALVVDLDIFARKLVILLSVQLGQLRLNPRGLGSKCGKWVERFSDFRKYKGNFRNHTTFTHLPHFEQVG